MTVTLPVLSGADDVTEEAGVITADGSDVWLGNGSSTTASFAGLRFANVAIPNGATITSARLEVNALGTEWHRINFEFAMEAAATSAAFTTSPPSQRALLAPRVTHGSDAAVGGGHLVSARRDRAAPPGGGQPGRMERWQRRGPGPARHRRSVGRKFAHAFESDPARAPRLVVTYHTP